MSSTSADSDHQPSSPFGDQQSSPLRDQPPSSPIIRDPPSPPVKSPQSSPAARFPYSSDDDEDTGPPSKKPYKFHEPEPVPPSSLYGPLVYHHGTDDTGESSLPISDEPVTISATNEPGDEDLDVETHSVFRRTYSDISSDSSVASTVLLSDESSSAPSSGASSECDDEDSEHDEQFDDSSDSESFCESSSDEDSRVSICKKVFEGSELSVDKGVLLVMDLFMKHKLEKTLVGDILQVILQFLPKDNSMSKSKHLLFKYVEDLCPLSPEKVHFYCKNCHLYLGEEPVNCTLCGSESHKFLQLCLSDQIRNLFQIHNLANLIDQYVTERMNHSEIMFSDICDGQEYKRARMGLGGQYDLVLHGYTDGVSLSESSVVTFWPLEFTICELAPKLRFRFVLVCGIWLDSSNPLMNTFVKPFKDELKDLYDNGVKWIYPESKIEYTSRVAAPGFCGDAPVRAELQHILCHGGRYCCNNCEQKMVRIILERTLDKKRVFIFQEEPSCLRTAPRMKRQGEITIKQIQNKGQKVNLCKGVKGRSVVSKIPTCDRSSVVYPEYMHILLGVVKQFMDLWFKTNEKDPWSLKSYRDEINAFLENIRVPDYLRVSRSTRIPNGKLMNAAHLFCFFL